MSERTDRINKIKKDFDEFLPYLTQSMDIHSELPGAYSVTTGYYDIFDKMCKTYDDVRIPYKNGIEGCEKFIASKNLTGDISDYRFFRYDFTPIEEDVFNKISEFYTNFYDVCIDIRDELIEKINKEYI